jgi:esterase/lipase superfamily enzyme
MKRIFTTAALLLSFLISLSLLIAASAAEVHNNNSQPNKVSTGASASGEQKDWLVIPVFYVTNRAFAGKNGAIDYAEEPNANGLLFGVKNAIVPEPDRSPIDQKIEKKLLWQRISTKDSPSTWLNQPAPKPSFDASKCSMKDKVIGRDEIVPTIKTYMKETGNEDLVIFIHGCCSTYDRSIERAATLAAHMHAPVLLYDWVSPKGLRMYLANETRAEQTVDEFCRSLVNVEKLINPGNIILIGHSMGTRFVDQALIRRFAGASESKGLARYKEIMLCNADIDAKAFLNHAGDVLANADKTYVFVSTADETLGFSAMAHGGFNRLGAPGALLNDLVKVHGAEIVDITENASKHEIPYWIVGNLYKFGNLGPVTEFQLKQIAPHHLAIVKTGVSQAQVKKSSAIDCACR